MQPSTPLSTCSRVDRHLSETMFEKSLFCDLLLVFIHPSFPISMHFMVHKAIVAQSPFLCQKLKSMTKTRRVDNEPLVTDGVARLTIDLFQAFTHQKFNLTPFEHIVRSQWPKQEDGNLANKQPLFSHILASHIRYCLRWMYSVDKAQVWSALEDKDVLRVLAVAILFGLDDFATMCVERYKEKQLSMATVSNDLEQICQLPHDHKCYLTLRESALAYLLRHGPHAPQTLAQLPVDYMADVLSADLLFVASEFERYRLLREVLSAYMTLVGRITWTSSGPVDQHRKRLSGFVKPLGNFLSSAASTIQAHVGQKRSRSSSNTRDTRDEIDEDGNSTYAGKARHKKQRKSLTRLSFSSTVPFATLMADASSGGVIDKATVLSYLLRTTVQYSNMTFDQLKVVRNDGIVDETIVFRALWQREAIDQIMYSPSTSHTMDSLRDLSTGYRSNENSSDTHTGSVNPIERDVQEGSLLCAPKFRFLATMRISRPCLENGWKRVDSKLMLPQTTDDQADEVSDVDDTISPDEIRSTRSDASLTPNVRWTKVFYSDPKLILETQYHVEIRAQIMPKEVEDGHYLDHQDELLDRQEYIDYGQELVCQFRLVKESQLSGNDAVSVTDTADSAIVEYDSNISCKIPPLTQRKSSIPSNDEPEEMEHSRQSPDVHVIPTGQEHDQNDASPTPTTSRYPTGLERQKPSLLLSEFQSPEQNTAGALTRRSPSEQPRYPLQQPTEMNYNIYCLNPHQVIDQDGRIDPEDRILAPVTMIQRNLGVGEPSNYMRNVKFDAYVEDSEFKIDIVVTMELFDFKRME